MRFEPRTWSALLLATALVVVGCSGDPVREEPARWRPPTSAGDVHAVTIVRPPSAGKLATDLKEISGARAAIGCATCHSAGAVAPLAGGNTPSPHSVYLAHADMQCVACHREGDPATLLLAGGEAVSLRESMTLCSQCHGLIRRAYDHGAHGGMRGYWDLQRGPRARNDCIVCHDPHAPAHPQVSPAPGPRDRFTRPPQSTGSLIEGRFESHESDH